MSIFKYRNFKVNKYDDLEKSFTTLTTYFDLLRIAIYEKDEGSILQTSNYLGKGDYTLVYAGKTEYIRRDVEKFFAFFLLAIYPFSFPSSIKHFYLNFFPESPFLITSWARCYALVGFAVHILAKVVFGNTYNSIFSNSFNDVKLFIHFFNIAKENGKHSIFIEIFEEIIGFSIFKAALLSCKNGKPVFDLLEKSFDPSGNRILLLPTSNEEANHRQFLWSKVDEDELSDTILNFSSFIGEINTHYFCVTAMSKLSKLSNEIYAYEIKIKIKINTKIGIGVDAKWFEQDRKKEIKKNSFWLRTTQYLQYLLGFFFSLFICLLLRENYMNYNCLVLKSNSSNNSFAMLSGNNSYALVPRYKGICPKTEVSPVGPLQKTNNSSSLALVTLKQDIKPPLKLKRSAVVAQGMTQWHGEADDGNEDFRGLTQEEGEAILALKRKYQLFNKNYLSYPRPNPLLPLFLENRTQKDREMAILPDKFQVLKEQFLLGKKRLDRDRNLVLQEINQDQAPDKGLKPNLSEMPAEEILIETQANELYIKMYDKVVKKNKLFEQNLIKKTLSHVRAVEILNEQLAALGSDIRYNVQTAKFPLPFQEASLNFSKNFYNLLDDETAPFPDSNADIPLFKSNPYFFKSQGEQK
jgi:hypothetical protein